MAGSPDVSASKPRIGEISLQVNGTRDIALTARRATDSSADVRLFGSLLSIHIAAGT